MKESIVAILVMMGLYGMLIITNPLDYSMGPIKNNQQAAGWEVDYPFENCCQNIPEKMKEESLFEKYNLVCQGIVSGFDKLYKNNVIYYDMIEWYGRITRKCGMTVIRDSEVITVDVGSDYLHYLQEPQDVEFAAEAIHEFEEWLKQEGMEFMYVQAPTKRFAENDTVKSIFDNKAFTEMDKLCNILIDANVNVMDLRDYMPKEHDAYMQMYYKTDHHWKVETGLLMARYLGAKLNDDYNLGIQVDKLEDDNFGAVYFSDLFIGSQGKKVSLGYCELEDFTLLIPNYENELQVRIPTRGIDATGDFEEVLIDYGQLKEGNPYSSNPYAAYLYGDHAMVQIENTDANSQGKLLFLKNSYANVVIPFLSLGCKQIDVIDLRAFDGSLRTYLKENKYDVIVFLTSSSGPEFDADFSMHNNLWDLR